MFRLGYLALVVAAVACGDDTPQPVPNDGSRPVTNLDGVPYGSTCADDTDCGGAADSCCTGGKCSPEGWCSPVCATDADCPAGFFCVSHSGTRCFPGCIDDRDCPTGFICEAKDNHLTCRFK